MTRVEAKLKIEPPKGLLWVNQSEDRLYVYDGIGWCKVAEVTDTLGRTYPAKVTAFMCYTGDDDDDTEQNGADGDS